MSGYFSQPFTFLITALFELYILAVMLRFLLQQVRADFYNPISQFLVKVTNPLLRPLRRIIPGVGGTDVASLVLMLGLQLLLGGILTALNQPVLFQGHALYLGGFILSLMWAVAELMAQAFNVFIFSILIQAILSWINPGAYNPVSALLYSLNEPVLRPLRRFIPPISGLDLSPLAAILGLQVVKMLVAPLPVMLVLGGL